MSEQLSLFPRNNNALVEYFYLLTTNMHIQNYAYSVRKILEKFFSIPEYNMRSVPHFTLVKLHCEEQDERIIQKLDLFSKGINCFTSFIQGPGIFKHGNTSCSLILEPLHAEPIVSIRSSLLKSIGFKENRMVPHITVLKQIPLIDFNKINIADLSYSGELAFQGISLLKKRTGETKYTKIYTSNFRR